MKRLTRQQAIRAKCMQCNGTSQEVRKCVDIECPLFRYRNGKEERDEFYKQSNRSRNFANINNKRKVEHLNVQESSNYYSECKILHL